MTQVKYFTFGPFSENTYILYDDTKECIIIDPGCYTAPERQQLSNFINQNDLKPVRLINTHCHLDHIFGNKYVADTYQLGLEIHQGEIPVLEAAPMAAQMYGIQGMQPSPSPSRFIKEGDTISFGNTTLSVLFTPGHSPASISFYCEKSHFVIGGDVLFHGSIGRTDLPGGNFNTLMESIVNQLLTLPDRTLVYSGHGPATAVGSERKTNPFILQYLGK
jgi:glyoxylase-like metal-dependent hydrolase (beta-lactamase superfamily II)